MSKTYAFLPNTPDTDSEIRLYRTFSKESSPASAGELKIDIPFNLLSASETNVQASLDRRIAANLRLKNLIEQYRALQKRNAQLLQDLSIPYLEAKKSRKKAVAVSDAKELVPADRLKRQVAEVILFQTGGKVSLPVQESRDLQAVQAEKKGREDSMPALEKYEALSLEEAYSKNPVGSGAYHQTYGRDTQMPWIFSLGLKLLRSLANNKIEILSWAAVMAVIGLVGLIVVKR
ncbi:hypothetical protein [Desulfobacter postgatei]|uniref:hypothetical protein n=1 Tax=Desulfobacter postgatei TaxID=2293 RepID=UPI002A3629DF|nr:hypothetical protein [Desulfobacter postgatei]MDX9962651.1 hypothetical protein [Desulfobacter postgatei]